MKSRNGRHTRHWTRAHAMMRPTQKAVVKSPARETQRGPRSNQPGPYEASYHVTFGYGFERPIVTP